MNKNTKKVKNCLFQTKEKPFFAHLFSFLLNRSSICVFARLAFNAAGLLRRYLGCPFGIMAERSNLISTPVLTFSVMMSLSSMRLIVP